MLDFRQSINLSVFGALKGVWPFTGFLIGASLLSPSNALAHVIGTEIDFFDTPQQVGDPAGMGIPNASEVQGAGMILGDYRDIQAINDGSMDPLSTTVSVNGGILSFSNNSVSAGAAFITWDGNDSPLTVDHTGLGGFDLTQGGEAIDFEVEILSSDLSGMELTLSVFDMNNNTSTLSRLFDSAIMTQRVEDFSFSDFTGTADFTNIGAIQLGIFGPAEIDVQIGSIETFGPHAQGPLPVPESSSSLALLSGAMLLVASRKIRRQ